MNNPAQQARMKHVLHQYTGEWGSGVQARQRQTESINNVPPLYLDDGTWAIKYSVKRRVPLVFEARITTVKCSTAWNVASQSESYLQPRWAIRCSALRLLSGSSPKTDGLFCTVLFIKADRTLVLRPT